MCWKPQHRQGRYQIILIFNASPCLSEKPGSAEVKSVHINIGLSADDAYDFNTDFKWALPSHWCLFCIELFKHAAQDLSTYNNMPSLRFTVAYQDESVEKVPSFSMSVAVFQLWPSKTEVYTPGGSLLPWLHFFIKQLHEFVQTIKFCQELYSINCWCLNILWSFVQNVVKNIGF